MNKSSAPNNGQGAEAVALRNIEQIAKIVLGVGKKGGKASRPQPSRKGRIVLDNGVELSLTHYMTYLGLKGFLADQKNPKDPTAEDIARWREDGTASGTINQHLTILRDKGLVDWERVAEEKPNGLIVRLRRNLHLVKIVVEQANEKLAEQTALDEIRKQLGGA